MSDHSSIDPETVCSLCGVGCRLRPGDGSRARGVAGPANPNGRLCRKGVRAFDTPDDRLTRPAVRRGDNRQSVTWAAAYDHVAERFEEIRDSYGPNALAFLGAPHCTNEENYLLQKLARFLGTNNIDNRARLCHVSTTRELSKRVGWPATTSGLADLTDSDVIIVAGANPAKRQPVAFNSFVRPAVNAGATLVHLDPVGNRTTRLADVHLAPRPGTDALVFDLLSAQILNQGEGIDRAFIAERTRGFGSFEASIADVEIDELRESAGVKETSIERVADCLSGANRVAGMVGTGIENSVGGTNASEALLNLLLLTGNIGRRGAGLYVLRGLVNEQGATDAGCVPDRLPGHQPVIDPEARARVASEWGTEVPPTPGKTATELLASFGTDVRGALVVGENPAVSKRDRKWVQERLNALDILVVVDPVSNETTEHADVILPAAVGPEKVGTFTNLERRVQRLSPVATPPGEARSDFRILCDFGAWLTDQPDEFEYADVSNVFGELCRIAPTHAELSYAELGSEGCKWPREADSVLYRERFETNDGRAQFGSVQPFVGTGSGGELRLVTGGRASGNDDSESAVDRSLRINPDDSNNRDIEDGEIVVVSDEDTFVRTTAELDNSVRSGIVYLPATVADPFLRQGTVTVSVSPCSESKIPDD